MRSSAHTTQNSALGASEANSAPPVAALALCAALALVAVAAPLAVALQPRTGGSVAAWFPFAADPDAALIAIWRAGGVATAENRAARLVIVRPLESTTPTAGLVEALRREGATLVLDGALASGLCRPIAPSAPTNALRAVGSLGSFGRSADRPLPTPL